MLEIFAQLPLGAHMQHPCINYVRVKEAWFSPRRTPCVLSIDGENFKTNGTIHIQCLPKQFQMFIPKNALSVADPRSEQGFQPDG